MDFMDYKNNSTVMVIRTYLICRHLTNNLGDTLAKQIIKYICDSTMMNFEVLQEINKKAKESLSERGYLKVETRQKMIFANLLYDVPFTKTIQDYLNINKSILYKNSDFYHPKKFINDFWIDRSILQKPIIEENVITKMALESFLEVAENILGILGRL